MSQRTVGSILILLLAGCSSGRTRPPAPVSSPSVQPENQRLDSGPWNFAYRSDTLSYQVTRSAAIESDSESAAAREIATNDTHEVLSLTVAADTIRYTATVDTFSTGTQGRIGRVQQVALPVQISGVLDSTQSASDSVIPTQVCDPVQSSLETDARNLLVRFPVQISPGTRWRDSTTRTACYGTIPMKAQLVRTFLVTGQTTYAGQNTVAIQRTDSVSAHGEGRQLQHRLTIDALGIGGATYYLSPEQSVVLHLTTSQDIDFVIQASGRTSRFRESTKQEYSLVR